MTADTFFINRSQMLLFITTACKNGHGFHRFGVCILFLREFAETCSVQEIGEMQQ